MRQIYSYNYIGYQTSHKKTKKKAHSTRQPQTIVSRYNDLVSRLNDLENIVLGKVILYPGNM